MINHIYNTCLTLERYATKRSRNFTNYIPYVLVGIILLIRIIMNIMWCTKDFIPNYEISEKFHEKFYNVFIRSFRTRFQMNVSENCI